MKRTINILTIIVIIVSLFLVESRRYSIIEVPGTSLESGGKKIVTTFADFPLDKQKSIDIEVDEETFNNFTEREQKDQVLDWLLYTTVYSSGMTAETLSEILYDLSPIRHGYMHPVADFEFGDTRSCVIGDKSIIAIIPRDIPENRYKDYLAAIADKHRKDLGELPKIIHIFKYKINLKERYALLKRWEDMNANVLFTGEYGYYTATVKNLADFNQFMDKIEDITYVEVVHGRLLLGGRKLNEHYRGIRVEDVAAIWQAEKEIQNRHREFNAKWQRKLNLLNKKLEEYNQGQRTYYSESERPNQEIWKVYFHPDKSGNNGMEIYKMSKEKYLAQQYLQSNLIQENSQDYQPPYMITSGEHYKREYEKLQKMMLEDFEKARIPDSSGFSLDPMYYFKGLSKYFSDINGLFKVISSLEPTLVKKEEIQKAVDALGDKDIVPLLIIVDKLEKCENKKTKSFAAFLHGMIEYHRFQAARYDGSLQGTEVGMVLFYTDLLAKLWALDFQNSIPGKDIENFIPIIANKVSPIYKQELLELPETRLWFGTNDKGFQKIGDSDRLLFARVAARVYAASSNPLKPGQEAEPNAVSAAFLGWWNDHYEEIARYEPEYQRLNEIMKWSILVAWLNDADKGDYLDFLQTVKVYKDNWFTKWVKSQPDLKFKKWNNIQFFKPGFLDSSTEAMAILYSRKYECFGQQRILYGGVSLAPRTLFRTRLPLSYRITPPIRTSNLNYAKTTITNTYKALQTIEGQSFNIQRLTPTRVSVIGIPKQGVKLRGLSTEIRPQNIRQIFSSRIRALEVEAKIGENQLGQLEISSNKNGFKVGWGSRDIDVGHSLARRMSKTENPIDVLMNEPNVSSAFQQGKDQFIIKLKESETWLKVVREEMPESSVSWNFQSRISDIEGGIKNYQLKWIKPSDLGSELKYAKSEYITIRSFKNTGKEMIDVTPTRGPPTNSKPFEIDYGHFKIKGRHDPVKREIYVEQNSIPSHLRENPDKLQQIFKNDLPKIIEAAEHPVGIIKYKGTNLLDNDAVVTYLRNKDYGQAAKEIVNNPQQLKSNLQKNLKDELLRIERFQDAGQYSRAGRHIDDLIEIYGSRTELKIRKGLLDIKRNRYIEAKNQFQDVLTNSKLTNKERVFQEINSHMDNSSLKVGFNENKNKINLEYSLDKNDQILRETTIANNKGKYDIYIQDDPTLTHLYWSPATKTGNLAQALRGHRVFRLLETDVDKIKPDILRVPNELAEKLMIKSSKINQIPTPDFFRFIPLNQHTNEDDDDYEDEKRKRVYLIFAE